MKTNIAIDFSAIFTKMIEDKRALNRCIREGGDLDSVAKRRGIKLATPI